MRDLDLPVLATDSRRLEVVVDGLLLFGGCQLAVDTTLVCAMHCDGTPHDCAANRTAWFLKEPANVRSVVSPNWWVLGRARLVVLAVELPKPGP